MNNMPFLVGGRRASHTQFYPGVNIQRGPRFSGGETTINFNYNNNGIGKAAKYNFFTNLAMGTLDFFSGLMPWNKGKTTSFQSFQSFGMSPFGMSPFQQYNSFQTTGFNPTGFGQSQAAGDPNLTKLQTVYSQYKVMPDSGGKYILTKGDGTAITGTFDELMAKATGGAQGTSTSATSSPATSSPATSTPATSTPTSEQTGFSAVKPDTLKAGNQKVVVHDDGKPSDISDNNATIGEIATDGDGKGLPKNITVKGNTYTYNAELSKTKGVPMYTREGGQSYRLEQNGNNVQLNQHDGDDGYNVPDISSGGAQKKGSIKSKQKTPAQETPAKNTPAKLKYADVKDQYTSQTVLDFNAPQITVKDQKHPLGITYKPVTISSRPPLKAQSVTVSAQKVAEFEGDMDKIKEFALKSMGVIENE